MAESVLFLLSSFLTLALIYLKVSSTFFEQLIAASLVLILILTRVFLSKITTFGKNLIRLSLVFLSALLIQLLVLSSGGFRSPFLILLHLFTLGISFLLNLSGAISFLIFSLILLILNIFLDPRLLEFFKEDVFTVMLYIISFLVIIPLAQLLIRTYHLKEALSNVLSQYLKLGQQREKSLLKGLTELVVVTDANLKILSVSEAVEKSLNLSAAELLGNSLFIALPLKDKAGNSINSQMLTIDNILSDRAARIINDCYLEASGKLNEVEIQIRPILDQAGKVSQLVFVISNTKDIAASGHADLQEALKRHQRLIAELKKFQPNLRIDILNHIEEDLLTALEMEDHPITGKISLVDVAELCQKISREKEEFAKSLGVSIKFILPTSEAAEAAKLSLNAAKIPSKLLGVSNFSIPTDPRWFQLIIEKLLDVAVLTAVSDKSSEVILEPSIEGREVRIVISVGCELKNKERGEDFFDKYYGNLSSRPYFNLGSGLEGYIAKMVAERLNIPLEANYENQQRKLKFVLKLTG